MVYRETRSPQWHASQRERAGDRRPRRRYRDDQRQGGRLRRRRARPGPRRAGYPLLEPEPGQAVQDPGEVVDATLAAIRTAAAAARDRGARTRGPLVQRRHALARRRSTPTGTRSPPLITWADMRAAEQAERLRREHPELHGRTGTPLHPMAPLTKLVWFARERARDLRRRARAGAGIKELVLARLTGAWAVDHSIASGTGLLDLRTLDWDPEALELAGIGASSSPPLVPDHRAPRADARAGRGELGLDGGLAGRRRRGRRPARQPRRRRGAPGRRRLLDRHQRRAAAHGRAPGGRSRAAGVLLRADPRALGGRRRDQQRRRRAALGRRGARARPRRRTPRRSCSRSPRASRRAATG